MNKLKIFFFRAYPRRYFGKFQSEGHTFFNGFPILFRIYEKFALTDNSVFTAEAGKHLVKRYNLLRSIRRARLLTVTEGRISYPYMLRHIQRHATMVEGYLRDLVIGVNLPVKIGVFNVLKRIFVLRLFKQVALRIFCYHMKNALLRSEFVFLYTIYRGIIH